MARGSSKSDVSRVGMTPSTINERDQRVAKDIAYEAHAKQKRRDKKPYITHVEAVVNGVTDPEAKVVAWLHDTLEDTKVTPASLRAAGISQRVIDAVQAMTHAPKTKEEIKALRKDPVAWEKDYLDYIEKQVKPNDLARQVKISDLKHNMADNDTPEQLARDRKALALLGG